LGRKKKGPRPEQRQKGVNSGDRKREKREGFAKEVAKRGAKSSALACKTKGTRPGKMRFETKGTRGARSATQKTAEEGTTAEGRRS